MSGQKIIDGLQEAIEQAISQGFKTCPCCDSKAGIRFSPGIGFDAPPMRSMAIIFCTNTECSVSTFHYQNTKRAIEIWNTRSLPFTDTDLVEALHEAFEEGRIYGHLESKQRQKLASWEHFGAVLTREIRAAIPAISKLRKAIGE